MKLPPLTRYRVEKTRKDAEYKDSVDKVVKLTGVRWIAVKLQLDKRGYKTAGEITRLLGSVKDHANPPAMLNWLLDWKNKR